MNAGRLASLCKEREPQVWTKKTTRTVMHAQTQTPRRTLASIMRMQAMPTLCVRATPRRVSLRKLASCIASLDEHQHCGNCQRNLWAVVGAHGSL